MSFLSKLFGGAQKQPSAPATIDHNGFTITPAPQKEGGQWRIAATISKDGKTHQLIRADTLGSEGAAIDATVLKAKQVIDQLGDSLFN